MNITDFAKEFKVNGVAVPVDETAIAFASQWAHVVLANYLLQSGAHQLETAKQMLGIKATQPNAPPPPPPPAQPPSKPFKKGA